MLVRIKATLEPELRRRARERALSLGLSLSEYVRRLLIQDLDEREALEASEITDLRSEDVGAAQLRLIGELHGP